MCVDMLLRALSNIDGISTWAFADDIGVITEDFGGPSSQDF
jgi:hypothetical protein